MRVGATVGFIVLGTPGGWRVEVSARVAEYNPRMFLNQLKPGQEPAWFQSKIDALSVAVYERLEQHDVSH